jgi:tRNA modification GTPase
VVLDPNDTIAAIASPTAPGPRGIVRLSGPRAWEVALAGFEDVGAQPPGPRPVFRQGRRTVAGLRVPLTVAIAQWRAPRTYTGQDIAEIHTTGSSPLIQLVLSDCLTRGARHAERGEFTLRAFLAGRLDLTQAEAVLAVIDAYKQEQLEAALRQLAGGLAGPIVRLRERLLDLLAHLEAGLDFVDEADVDPIARVALETELAAAAESVRQLANRLELRDRPPATARVVLAGRPNAGKSTLFNALLGESRAIVSPQAGTTRDYITAPLNCDGLTVELVDTAGRDMSDEALGARAQALGSDLSAAATLVLECVAPESMSLESGAGPVPALRVWTKADLSAPPGADYLSTSAQGGVGLRELGHAIAAALRQQLAEGDLAATTGARCRDNLGRAAEALQSAAIAARRGDGHELVAIDIRQAVDELGRVVGAVVTDDILDRVFERFCIGK